MKSVASQRELIKDGNNENNGGREYLQIRSNKKSKKGKKWKKEEIKIKGPNLDYSLYLSYLLASYRTQKGCNLPKRDG